MKQQILINHYKPNLERISTYHDYLVSHILSFKKDNIYNNLGNLEIIIQDLQYFKYLHDQLNIAFSIDDYLEYVIGSENCKNLKYLQKMVLANWESMVQNIKDMRDLAVKAEKLYYDHVPI